MADSISAIPQQPQLGRIAQFLRYLETQKPEFLPSQLDVMGLIRQLALPQSSTVENLSYGNLPFTMPPAGTGAMIPQVKTGRKPEVADLIGMLGGVPGVGAVSDVATKLSNEAADAIVRAIMRNPEATATGVIRETSMPFMQAVAPRTPGLLETPVKSELGFYSALEQATIPLQNKGTGSQFLAQIEKTAGVKPDEIKWTGLDEFLKSRQNVTKQEIQDYLAANRVNLQEVRLGQGIVKSFEQWAADQGFGPEALRDFGPTLRNSYEAFKENASQKVGAAKFSQHTLPGGENYREILLTLPSGPRQTKFEVFDPSTQRAVPFETREEAVAFANQDPTRSSVVAEVDVSKPEYRSSHFDQPNILAHMRVNDRVVDGKKTLFIEEIQSDWHQAGRKKGYDTPEARAAEQQKLDNILAERQTLLDEQLRLEKLAEPYTSQGRDAPREIVDQWSIVSNRLNNLQIEQNRLGRGFGQQVPDAPFKTTWHELTLKRAIQEASEKGYDQIAFTTGKTQVERYPEALRQVADDISWKSSGAPESGNRFIEIKKSGNTVLQAQVDSRGVVTSASNQEAVGKPIEELIGKPMGQQVVSEPSGSIKGEQFTVGGKGMEGFYDQILPKSLEKLGKKFDAKVGKIEMDGVEVWAMDITPKMRESVLTKGQPLFAATPAIPAVGLLGDENE